VAEKQGAPVKVELLEGESLTVKPPKKTSGT
jgi:hypothetical protein